MRTQSYFQSKLSNTFFKCENRCDYYLNFRLKLMR